MKNIMHIILALFIGASLLLTGCATRSPGGESSTAKESPSSEVSQELESSETPTPSASEESSPEDVQSIDDPEKLEAATEIVLDTLERADMCDTIYRAALDIDENMPATTFDGEEKYQLVMDGHFVTTDDIMTFWSNTFVAEPVSSERYNSLSERKVYVSMNQQLYMLDSTFDEPLTVGEWDASTLRVVRFTDDILEVSMETSLVGSPAGRQTLRLKQNGGTWRLTDTYFLD